MQRLRHEHGVGWGVKKLRQITALLAAALDEQRPDAQVDQLLHLLEQASASKGKHKPVLSVGRDGITLGLQFRGLRPLGGGQHRHRQPCWIGAAAAWARCTWPTRRSRAKEP